MIISLKDAIRGLLTPQVVISKVQCRTKKCALIVNIRMLNSNIDLESYFSRQSLFFGRKRTKSLISNNLCSIRMVSTQHIYCICAADFFVEGHRR